jgi:hypothetical protein
LLAYDELIELSGRGPSVWDDFVHSGNKIAGNATGDVACDSYHKYKDDIKILKEMGVCIFLFLIHRYKSENIHIPCALSNFVISKLMGLS